MTSPVPPMWKQKLGTLFKRFDKAGKGHLTRDDINSQVDLFEAKGCLNSTDGNELRDLFGKLWSFFFNGSDSVDLEQWIKSHLTLIIPGTSKVNVWDNILKRTGTLMFRAADKQGRGIMSEEEFSIYLTCLGLEGDKFGKDIFKRLNVSSDGKVSEDEFLQMFYDFVYNKEDAPSKELMGPLCC
ncbi:uncharacterized protein LOC135681658 [Rhopilema esculentum]|uniref:uncharacterized protein LOC135681658 n=1 Tax=Rhopilema esculentum TaxID=499914 RepID=UPI0031DE82D2|eukprot:gene13557-4445_t